MVLSIRSDKYMKKRVTYTFNVELIERLKLVSEKTMIPQSRLAEQAINEYLKKMEKADN
jgi:predicted DNA-binding protein